MSLLDEGGSVIAGPIAAEHADGPPPVTATGLVAETSLGHLVETQYPRLLRLARLICRDAADAADAVQIGLEQAWRHRAQLRDDAAAAAWLDRIVVREAVRVARSRRSWLDRIRRIDSEVGWAEPSDPAGEPSADRPALRAAFARLSPEQRAVIALHLHLGHSVAETAELVGAPVETVRSRLRLARERLRRELEETR